MITLLIKSYGVVVHNVMTFYDCSVYILVRLHFLCLRL